MDLPSLSLADTTNGTSPGVETGLSCAATVATTLHAAGVRYVFGHPGGEVLDLIDAMQPAGLRFVLTGHESAAAFMAGVVGRLTGVPGVCLATLGPGACNLVLGVANALLDRDPLLAFSACTTTERSATHTKQNLALNDLFAPITKWSVRLHGAATARTLSSAFEVACRPPRGPVFLSLGMDVAAAPDSPAGNCPASPVMAVNGHRDLSAIVRTLAVAKRPVAVVGIALHPSRDAAAVRRFLEATGLPFTVLPQAKGLVDESSDRFLGTICGGGDSRIVEWVESSDCLLGIGFDPVESSQGWYLRAPVFSIANSSLSFGEYQPVAECCGEITPLLFELLGEFRGSSGWTNAEILNLRNSTERALCPPCESSSAGLSPYHVVRTLSESLPVNTIVSADVGAHKMLLAQTWQSSRPGSFLVSNGLSSMGFGVPAAIAASLVHPDCPVVGIIGDGGFGMMVQELETARRLGVKPLFVVFCDRSLAIVRIAQRIKGMPHVGVDFAPVNWAAVSAGFGASGESPQNLGEFRDAIERWARSPELTVLAVPIDPDLYQGLSY